MKQYNLKLDEEKDKDIIQYLENMKFKKTICRLIRAEIKILYGDRKDDKGE